MLFDLTFRCDSALCTSTCDGIFLDITKGTLDHVTTKHKYNSFPGKKVGEIACIGSKTAHALQKTNKHSNGVCKAEVSWFVCK